jgi:uncharacterized protein
MFLIWNGDILTLYALCGLLLLPSIRLPWPALVFIGAAFIVLAEIWPFGIDLPSSQAAAHEIALARYTYGHGRFMAILAFRWHEAWSLIVPLLISVLPRTTGLMYLGMAVWRSGLLRKPELPRSRLAAAIAVGAVVGVPITVNEIWSQLTGHALWSALRLPHVDASLLLALAYVAALLLWLTPRRVSFLPGVAAAGQIALTNYLVQSIVLGFIFYGYGFGLLGRIGSASAACMGVALYTTQIKLSREWLRRFQFGPFEWLWRSLSYGRWQPMRRLSLLTTGNLSQWEREV